MLDCLGKMTRGEDSRRRITCDPGGNRSIFGGCGPREPVLAEKVHLG